MQYTEIHEWIPSWNIYYKVGVDGISVLFIILITILSILCVSVSWKAIKEKKSVGSSRNLALRMIKP